MTRSLRSPHHRLLHPLLLLLPFVPPAQASVFHHLDPAASRLVASVAAPARPGAPERAGVSLLGVDRAGVEAFRDAGGGALSLPLADGTSLELELEPYDLLAAAGALTTRDETGQHAYAPDVSLYRGRVAGEPDSWAVIAMGGEGVFGAIEHAGQRWNLGPALRVPSGGGTPGAALPAHALSPESARGADATPFTCGIDAGNEDKYTVPRALDEPRLPGRAGAAATALQATRTVWKIAVDCDYEVFHLKFADNLTAAASYVLTVLGTVNLIYERDLQATLTFPYVNLWTTIADPYSASTTGSQLTQMQGYWATNNAGIVRSAAFLMSGRPLGGGLALIGSLCTTASAYGLAAMDFTYTYPTATSTWDVDVFAHELGHIFGSWHTQSCNWSQQGYLPAATTIDSCFASEGGCAVYTNRLPSDKGTIMSYCHVAYGVANGIRLDFHPLCVQRMRAIMAVSACSTQALPQPPGNPAAVPVPGGVRVSWSASPTAGVLGYEVFRSPYPFDLHPTLAGFTAALQFDDAAIGANWYRVRALRAADTSSWSGEVKGTSACGFTAGAPFTIGAGAYGVASGDFNADGREDLVSLKPGANQLVTLFGEGAGGVGNGAFGPPFTSATGVAPACLAVDDLNGDGILDVLVGISSDGSLLLHRGAATSGVPNGNFLAPIAIASLPLAARVVRVADFNEDGIPDVVACADGSVLRTMGQGTGGVPTGLMGPVSSAPVSMTTADVVARDLNADGILDLVVSGSAGLRILPGVGLSGRGDGTFAPASVALAAGTDPGALAVQDLDLDGASDIVVCDRADSVVRVFMGHRSAGVPDGTFTLLNAYPCGTNPSAITVADWDHDGVPDLVVANDDPVGHVRVLLGLGDGRLQPMITLASGGGRTDALLATDFDEDDALDVLAVNRAAGNGMRIAGTCPGALSTAVTLLSPNGGEAWAVDQERTVSWTRGAGVLGVDVELSTDSGVHWHTIAREISATSWKWSVTGPTTAHARLRVVAHGFPQSKDASNADFTLAPGGTLAVGDPPARVSLLGAWPNPARSELTVSFTLPAGATGSIDLVDLLGRRVVTRDVSGLGAGAHQVRLLERAALSPGVYLVRLRAAGALRLAKVTVVR